MSATLPFDQLSDHELTIVVISALRILLARHHTDQLGFTSEDDEADTYLVMHGTTPADLLMKAKQSLFDAHPVTVRVSPGRMTS